MALIKCPKCAKEISDQAENCIHCQENSKVQKSDQNSTEVLISPLKLAGAQLKYIGKDFLGYFLSMLLVGGVGAKCYSSDNWDWTEEKCQNIFLLIKIFSSLGFLGVLYSIIIRISNAGDYLYNERSSIEKPVYRGHYYWIVFVVVFLAIFIKISYFVSIESTANRIN